MRSNRCGGRPRSATRVPRNSHEHQGVIVDQVGIHGDEILRGCRLGAAAVEDRVQNPPPDAVQRGQCPMREPVTQPKWVECEESSTGASAAREFGTHRRIAGQTRDLHLVEVRVEYLAQGVGSEQVYVKRILEIGGGVGGEHHSDTVIAQNSCDLGHVAFRVGEVLDDVRRTHPRLRRRGERQHPRISADRSAQTARRGGGGERVIVHPGDSAVNPHQRGRFFARAAADVRSGARTHRGIDQSIASGVQRDQRRWSVISDRAFAGG